MIQEIKELTNKEVLKEDVLSAKMKDALTERLLEFLQEISNIMQSSALFFHPEYYGDKISLSFLEVMQIWTKAKFPPIHEEMRLEDLDKLVKALLVYFNKITSDMVTLSK